MNEFEWRHQLRNLRQPAAPQRDLWAGIEQALDADRQNPPAEVAPSRVAWLFAAGLAAVSLLAVGLARQQPSLAAGSAAIAAQADWKPADPRLAGAAIELGAARMELREAIAQAPDSAALRRLLARTEQQQSRLRRLGRDAG
ncbi:MAG: hypothetical protein KGN77_03655 [Xanthomonadaceae bacterium]|nr:hypothetical protein [Xanthomonadaceae bacterium]MDE1963028.1 hypothetical protein [Xanthomonadaceae bacterium]